MRGKLVEVKDETEESMLCDCDCEGGVCSPDECDCSSPDGCEGGCCGWEECRCMHHGLMGWLVVAFGLTFLLGAFNVLDMDVVNLVWPIIVVLAGLKMVFARMCKCC